MLKSIYGVKHSALYKAVNIKKDIGSNRIGENLTLDYYDKIKKLRPYNDLENMTKWQEVIDLASKALQSTKDLNIVIWLIEASVHKEKLKGLENFHILYDLISKYPNCYPEEIPKKQTSINYLKDNVFSWLAEEEIIPGLFYKDVFSKINSCTIDGNIAEVIEKHSKSSLQKYLSQKKIIIENLVSLFEKMDVPSFAPLVGLNKSIIEFLQTLERFYVKLIFHLNTKKSEKKVEEPVLSTEQIYVEINKLVEQGIKIDKQDILLHLMAKIILLQKKGCLEVYKVLREDSISKIINS